MSDSGRFRDYFDTSYPADVINPPDPTPPAATGATAGTPGVWTPAGATAPATVAALQAAVPPIVASPATLWAPTSWVDCGDGADAYWDGDSWVAGRSP